MAKPKRESEKKMRCILHAKSQYFEIIQCEYAAAMAAAVESIKLCLHTVILMMYECVEY